MFMFQIFFKSQGSEASQRPLATKVCQEVWHGDRDQEAMPHWVCGEDRAGSQEDLQQRVGREVWALQRA